jgi:hypothetical protein
MKDNLTIEIDEQPSGFVKLTFIYDLEYIKGNPEETERLLLLFGISFLTGEHFETKSKKVYIIETRKDLAIYFLNTLKHNVTRGKEDIEQVLGEYSV